ncbi:MAG: 2-oxoacid:ferredoxin oxidoreductase subunit beta [Chitinophagaceae bacterium]|nr:2-oxoacid:ferredoxin oxidoreductase subunit beta [Chitinophagaceae bacterium]
MSTTILTPKDFTTDQEVRWCPGCGDYSILKQMQTVLPTIGVPKENIVIISGIGCSSRFPYYMNTFGLHSIHGRAPSFASGLKTTRPELSVWIVTGDGDALSIGGNHLIHTLRRNFNLQILLFNNQIYGLTKGQYSPTSEEHKITKSTPMGSLDHPFNPAALALGADASFFARSLDRDPKHLQMVLKRSHEHQGAALVEIYQNCNIFNDGAFELFTEKNSKAEKTIFVEHGQPLVFGNNKKLGIKLDGTTPKIVELENESSINDLWIHDEKDLIKASILSRMYANEAPFENFPRPFGVFYAKERPCYDDLVQQQMAQALEQKGAPNLDALLKGKETWTVQ